jgi:hypothetical protein
MSAAYKGKHKHGEIAEFVVEALAVWDRQHGRPSRTWKETPDYDRGQYTQRVRDHEEGKLNDLNKTARGRFENRLYELLAATPDDENETIKKENEEEVKKQREAAQPPKPAVEPEKKEEKKPIEVAAETESVGVAHGPTEGALTSPIKDEPRSQGKPIK